MTRPDLGHYFMAIKTATCTPQHSNWFEDLPLRNARVDGRVDQFEDLSALTSKLLTISRADNLIRGLSIFLLPVLLLLSVFIVWGFFFAFGQDIHDAWPVFIAAPPLAFLSIGLLVAMFRLDLRAPRGLPVQFNRATQKIRALEWSFVWWKPFSKWPISVKEFNWDDTQAEIHKQAGVNGKAYVVRYFMVLCHCKPGATEVVERIVLKGNRMTTASMFDLWNFLRVYMKDGIEALPMTRLKPMDISFRRSFFNAMPYIDPTEDGAAIRRASHPFMLSINIVLSILLFPLWALMGIGHYIAMRCAPEPQWPDGS